jgi:hypothetical protein
MTAYLLASFEVRYFKGLVDLLVRVGGFVQDTQWKIAGLDFAMWIKFVQAFVVGFIF